MLDLVDAANSGAPSIYIDNVDMCDTLLSCCGCAGSLSPFRIIGSFARRAIFLLRASCSRWMEVADACRWPLAVTVPIVV